MPLKLPKTWPKGKKPLYEAEVCDGTKQGCKRKGKGCTKNHAKPKDWSVDMRIMMINVVKEDDNLGWNPKLMTPELMKCQYIKYADEES